MALTWHVWLILSLILFALEIFVPGFVLAGFGIGALFAMVSSVFTDWVGWHLLSFGLGTFAFFVTLRPLYKKYLNRCDHTLPTGIQAMIGKRVKVLEAISEDPGVVKVGGEQWQAVAEEDTPLPVGSWVIITKVEGATLTVKKE
jgi:membrane protein implicated in regulation of membrane protease activity